MEAPLIFIERWTKSLRELQITVAPPSFDATKATELLQNLSSQLTERAGELPSHELGRCERELKSVRETIAAAKGKTGGKPKFSFKRTTASSSASSATPTPQSVPRPSTTLSTSTGVASSTPALPSTPFTLSFHSNTYLSFDSLPPSTSQEETLLLQDLDNCFIDLLPSSESVESHEEPVKFSTMYLSGLRDCTVLLPVIGGSVMVSDCQDSRIILGSHQFRMHDSTGCTVYLETGSTPIIEGCKDLVFDRYPSIFTRDSKVDRRESSRQLKFIQDFDFPFATLEQNPSPNWRFATVDDRPPWVADQEEDWTSREGRKRIWETKKSISD